MRTAATLLSFAIQRRKFVCTCPEDVPLIGIVIHGRFAMPRGTVDQHQVSVIAMTSVIKHLNIAIQQDTSARQRPDSACVTAIVLAGKSAILQRRDASFFLADAILMEIARHGRVATARRITASRKKDIV